MAKRGFLAEVNHQAKQAQKRNVQRQREFDRAQAAAVKQHEKAMREAERAQAAWARTDAANRREAEKVAKLAHAAMMQAEAEAENAKLRSHHAEIDSILGATLDVDDFVDLDSLRAVPNYPQFPRPDLMEPIPAPTPVRLPPQPVFVAPEPPSGMGALFGASKKHAKAMAAAQEDFAEQFQFWQHNVRVLSDDYDHAVRQHEAAEAGRLAEVALAEAEHERLCRQLDADAVAADSQVERLKRGLAKGDAEAVDEYIGIVLGNSVYPDDFEVEHAYEFDAELSEVAITAWIPGPEAVRSEKEFKYIKARDEITSTTLSKKAQSDRYAGAVHQVALRTLHEVFEADRRQLVGTISLTVATEGLDPATGQPQPVAFVAAAAERESFLAIDLANVTPVATLDHLGAVVSKKPFDLVGIDTSSGVRSL